MQIIPPASKQRPLEQSPVPTVNADGCPSLTYSCCICGLTHSFACLVCSVPHLYKGLFGLGRGQNTASVGLHSRDGHGGGGMLQIVNVTSHFLENTPLRASAFFSPLFPKLFFTRHTLTVWRMWNGMRARVAESFFCWLPALGFWLSLVSEYQASFTFWFRSGSILHLL